MEHLEGEVAEGDQVVVDRAPDGERLVFQRAELAETARTLAG